MAALCTGISYGLSQSCLSNNNKELIFVKLTDSAFRAIEDYQKNQVSRHPYFYITRRRILIGKPKKVHSLIRSFDMYVEERELFCTNRSIILYIFNTEMNVTHTLLFHTFLCIVIPKFRCHQFFKVFFRHLVDFCCCFSFSI